MVAAATLKKIHAKKRQQQPTVENCQAAHFSVPRPSTRVSSTTSVVALLLALRGRFAGAFIYFCFLYIYFFVISFTLPYPKVIIFH